MNKLDKAIEYINKAIEHTPTVCELYLLKARIYLQMGNRATAAKLAEEARMLDTADRNLNFESVQYQLAIDEVDQAHELMGLFSYEVWKG